MGERDELLARAGEPAKKAARLHAYYRGKIQMMPKCPVGGLDDFAVWYTPGVAEPCKAIHAAPELVYEHTNKANTIAIVSDGSRVLGLGDIGPEAGLPVMEGKALLFKYLGGIDAVPLCIGATDAGDIVQAVRWLEPSFGGINLEDIAQPKCFEVLARLRESARIPVWHDDQQGSATVALAAAVNALTVVGKEIGAARFALIGAGAANIAVYRLLKAAGAAPGAVIACDSRGTLHPGRRDIEQARALFADKWRLCLESNRDRVAGGAEAALRGADVCIAFSRSGPDVIRPAWIRAMARDAVVFACANPVPEIWPWDALDAGAAIVGTGRGDFPNQVNNSLAFPGLFRGVLDVRARSISDGMALAAARELAACVDGGAPSRQRILPAMDEASVAARIAAAVGMAAQAEGLAVLKKTREEIFRGALERIAGARRAASLLVAGGAIRPRPAI
ncbi:MAG: NAD(P)-dependent malic enzyme [Alphaproteobacteria bacterium]